MVYKGWFSHNSIGQNIVYGARNWTEAIKVLHSEVKDYTYGKYMGNNWVIVGHYTQVI